MKIKPLSVFKYVLLLGLSVGILLYAFKGISLADILLKITEANLFWIAISFLISILSLLSRAYRWKLLIEPLGYSPLLKNTTYSLCIGYFANLAFPRLGEVSRCGALSKADNIPFNKLLGTVIVERVIDVLSLLVCVLFAAIIEYKRLGNFFTENIFNPAIGKFRQLTNSPLFFALTIMLLAGVTIAIIYLYRKGRKKGTESVFSRIMKGFIDGLRSVANLKRPWLFVFHSILIWILYYLGVYVALFCFPFTSHLGPGAALFLLVAGGLGMSAPVQGGIGTYHLFVSQGLVLYGLSQQDGLTFATLLHSLQLLMVILLGIASLFLLFTKKRMQQPIHVVQKKAQ